MAVDGQKPLEAEGEFMEAALSYPVAGPCVSNDSLRADFELVFSEKSRQECLLYWSRTDIPVCSA